MLTCPEYVEQSGVYTNICSMPLMPGASYCRIHTKKDSYKIIVEQKEVKEFVDEHYLSTDISLDLFDDFEQSFQKIKKFLPLYVSSKIQKKYTNDSGLKYKDLNEIFDNIIPGSKIIVGKYSLRMCLRKIRDAGWKEYDKYSEYYDTIAHSNLKMNKNPDNIVQLKDESDVEVDTEVEEND